MGAYPQMVRDIASLKEEALVLAARTITHIDPEKRSEFERRVAPVKGLTDALNDDTGQGLSVTSSLSNNINGAISLGKKHGGQAFARVRPMWHHLRDKCEVVGRRFELFNSWREEDLQPNLWWMAECGGLTDLHLLLQLKRNVPDTYQQVPHLIDHAIEQISNRSTGSIKELCQFFAFEDDELNAESLSRELVSGHLSLEEAQQIEDLQGIKEVIEEQNKLEDFMEFINVRLRRLPSAHRRAAVNDKVNQLIEQFQHAEDELSVEWDEGGAQDEEVACVEAFAVAQISNYEPGEKFWLGETYTIQAGLQSTGLADFEVQPVEVPQGDEPLEFDLIVYAEDMEITPDWKQTHVFNRKDESPLLEFFLTPTKVGEKVIRVEFLYQLHWLATIRFDVTVAHRTV